MYHITSVNRPVTAGDLLRALALAFAAGIFVTAFRSKRRVG